MLLIYDFQSTYGFSQMQNFNFMQVSRNLDLAFGELHLVGHWTCDLQVAGAIPSQSALM